jgi:hypothetical protein
MDASSVEALGRALLDSIGPCNTGSPGMTSASDWAIALYMSWSIDAKRENYGSWRGWRRGVSHIDLMVPRALAARRDACMESGHEGQAGEGRGDHSRIGRHHQAHVQPFARARIRRTLAHLTGHLLGTQLTQSARRRIDDQAARKRISAASLHTARAGRNPPHATHRQRKYIRPPRLNRDDHTASPR